MEIKLKNLLQRTLVVPFDVEETELLEKVCETYVDDEDFSDDSVADLAIVVLTHTPNEHVKKKLAELYEELRNESLSMAKPVCEALAAYTLYKATDNGDIANNLAMLNCMVLMNKRWEHTPFPDLFAACIEKSQKEVDNMCRLESVDDAVFLTKLYGNNNELEETALDSELLKILKQLARDAWYHRTHDYINSEELKKFNTYIKAYVALEHIVSSMPWDFLNERVITQIKELVPNTKAKAMTIEAIAEMLRPYYDKKKEPSSHSSLLLHVIADKEHRAMTWPFMKTKLTVREFAVYLYYELILEKYIG